MEEGPVRDRCREMNVPGFASETLRPWRPLWSSFGEKKGAIARAHPRRQHNEKSKSRKAYLPPNPAVCIDCREMSAVEAMPCIRSLKSSALEAFSSAVS